MVRHLKRCANVADIAQLAERDASNVEVIGSMPIVRSITTTSQVFGCSVWRFNAHTKRGARKGVAVMEKVSTVCRLARSKSSALGAENRRFKSFHTDQVYKFWRRSQVV